MAELETKNSKHERRRWILPVIVLILAGIAFLVYTQQYYHADESASCSLESDETVKVVQTDYGWLFDGPSETDAIIFYPGLRWKKQHTLPCFTVLPDRVWMPVLSKCRFAWLSLV